MYNLGDHSYKSQPKFISRKTIAETVQKIKTHCSTHDVKRFTFILHGGEPLLMPKTMFIELIEQLNSLASDDLTLVYALQTNGMLIDKEWCAIFDKYAIGVGVSIDGPKAINDQYRIDKKGGGTYDMVMKGVENSRKYQKNRIGFLSVMNLALDPMDAFNHLKSIGTSAADFLLLDLNYDTAAQEKYELEKTPSANWYIQIFNEWFHTTQEERMQIRFFNVIIHRILGGLYSIDNLGAGENNVLVLETDGGLEAVDVLKICGDGFTKDNINIHTHHFEDALNAPLAEIYYK
jgi:uncharacterized protein